LSNEREIRGRCANLRECPLLTQLGSQVAEFVVVQKFGNTSTLRAFKRRNVSDWSFDAGSQSSTSASGRGQVGEGLPFSPGHHRSARRIGCSGRTGPSE